MVAVLALSPRLLEEDAVTKVILTQFAQVALILYACWLLKAGYYLLAWMAFLVSGLVLGETVSQE